MRVALAGNPNSGKTTLFNTLTGSSARVGNWPGVTVDKREGTYRFREQQQTVEKIHIVDLPGIYSLSPYTPEEVIARQFIMDEKPDLIINIVDATNLERNLYLTTQLLEIDIPVVVALNMMDIIEREGSEIDARALSEKLGVPVVPISALHTNNVKTLLATGVNYARQARQGVSCIAATPLGGLYEEVSKLVQAHNIAHRVFHTIKLIEDDSIEQRHASSLTSAVQHLKIAFEKEHPDIDYEAEVADLRYKFITNEVKPAVVKIHRNRGVTRSEKIDAVLTHRVWGMPVFLFIMFAAFHFIFAEDFLFLKRLAIVEKTIPSIGVLLQNYMGDFQRMVGHLSVTVLENADAAPWAIGLLVDGLINGICAVLTFLPQILLLFLFLSILEDSGYMARVAFLMDRPLRRFGLSGKAFLPMLMGFGCSVPAMMGTRTLENDREKRLTLMLIPFFSCGAKLGIWTIIVAAVFPSNTDLVIFGIYLTGIVVAVMAAMVLKKLVFRNGKTNFVLELPMYRWPRFKNTMHYLWEKIKGFLITVTTTVALATLIIWFLQNFNFHLQLLPPGHSAESILGQIGSSLTWLFVPLGFGLGPEAWRLVVAILTGLVAKELVSATLGVLYIPGFSAESLETTEGANVLIAALAALAVFTPLAAISFMIFNLLCIPCFVAVGTAHAELKSFKWTAFTLCFWFATAWIVTFLVYQTGALLLSMNLATISILLLAVAIFTGSMVYAFTRRNKKKYPCGGCSNCDGCSYS